MRWLLITTNPTPQGFPGHPTWNIGDVLARLGTELAVRGVDPSAEFSYLNVDNPDDYFREQEFDFCLFAGRPLFWPGCRENHVHTHILDSWPAARKDRIAAFGVGVQYPLEADRAVVRADIEATAEKMHSILLRTPLTGGSTAVRVGCCPAAFLVRPTSARLRLCNFMPRGGHCPEFSPTESGRAVRLAEILSPLLRARGFKFIAHLERERAFALDLGWPEELILFSPDNIEQYIDWYSSAVVYVGNRVHGAILSAVAGARVTCIGYDTRNYAVESLGGVAVVPSVAAELLTDGFFSAVACEPLSTSERQAVRFLPAVGAKVADTFLRTLVEQAGESK